MTTFAVTSAQHLQWCRDRARARLDDPAAAAAGLIDDLHAHPDTALHPAGGLIALGRLSGGLRTAEQLLALIDREVR